MFYRLVGLLLLVAVYVAPVARAESLMIAGTTLSNTSSYTYVGMVDPLGGGEIGKGWFASYIGSYLTYDYQTLVGAALTDISATAPGLDAGLGYAWSDSNYWLNISAMLGYRDFSLDPDVPTETPRGGQEALTLQLQWDRQWQSGINLNLLTSYSAGPDTSFLRLRMARAAFDGWRLGPEFVYQKGENYQIDQLGLVVYRPRPNWSWEFALGESTNQDGESGAYLTVALVKPF